MIKCPSCKGRIAVLELRDSFTCRHCAVQLKTRTHRVLLAVLFFGPLLWLLAEAAFFGFRSGWVSFFLLSFFHLAVVVIALPGALENDSTT
jgi:hypothetical protein